jgi:hypothetical protein
MRSREVPYRAHNYWDKHVRRTASCTKSTSYDSEHPHTGRDTRTGGLDDEQDHPLEQKPSTTKHLPPRGTQDAKHPRPPPSHLRASDPPSERPRPTLKQGQN